MIKNLILAEKSQVEKIGEMTIINSVQNAKNDQNKAILEYRNANSTFEAMLDQNSSLVPENLT